MEKFPLVQLPKKFKALSFLSWGGNELKVSISSTSEEVQSKMYLKLIFSSKRVSISSTSEEVQRRTNNMLAVTTDLVSISSTSEEVQRLDF